MATLETRLRHIEGRLTKRQAEGEDRAPVALDPALQLSLRDFARQAWGVIEPVTPLQWGRHHDAMCEHLEAVTNGQIRDLLITIPPRHTKSILCSILWPAWEWGPRAMPWTRWLTSSYGRTLATDHAVKTRHLMKSGWYQRRWSHVFHFIGDQDQKGQYENNRAGYRIAVSVGGGATGRGGDRILVDDAHEIALAGKVLKRETDAERLSAVTWWKTTMSSRRNNPKESARIVIQQRVHTEDVAGACIEDGSYVHLNLPSEFEPQQRCITFVNQAKFWEDWRTEPGELLCPERFGPEQIAQAKRDLGSVNYSALYQQSPVPAGGGLIKLAWFKRYGTPPAEPIRIIQSWDTANKAKELNDPWACTTWAETETGYYLLDVYCERMEYPDGKRAVKSLAEQWTPSAILIEDKSSGQSLLQDLQREGKLPVLPVEPESDKVTRMSVESPLIEAGRVWLPESAAWLLHYETELAQFPHSAHFDQVDSTSQALRWFRENELAMPRVRWIRW
jgi:predicted phage terminase large subunit-like protein